VQGDAEDHCADVLGGGRLEQVSATTGAVADVVANQVGDNGRVTRIVLGDAGLDFAHQVRAHVGGFGVDTTTQLSKQRHKGRAEAEANDLERHAGYAICQALGSGRASWRRVEAAKDGVDAQH